MQLTEHFKKQEFACRCGCGFAEVSNELLEVLEALRSYFKQPITITSGCRCSKYNRHVGGAKNSTHQAGIAADIVVKNVDPIQVHHYLISRYPKQYGIGKYLNFTHFDVRSYCARWEG